MFGPINWLAVVVGTVFNMVLGFLWYGPFFGKVWMAQIGKRPEEMKSGGLLYLWNTLAVLVTSIVLALLIRGLDITGWGSGALAGAVIWLGIGATSGLTRTLFEGVRPGVWLIYTAYQLVGFAVLGALFAAWR